MNRLSKVTKFIRNNLTSLIFFMILLVLVLLVILVVSVLLPTTNTSVYGDRLDGIEDVEITDKELDKVVESLEGNEIVESAKVKVNGKIINIQMTLTETATIDAGKALGASTITEFDSDEIEYYDFQVFVTSSGASSHTVIGYKTPNTETLSWTNN